ncbi:hypothetical protein [Catellatospora sp. NPDC049609]|uniref:hypothetical protein n=1 Tax=Catellatospora sp. NPDC049609 TaxID=3155505 RepID=UPI0034182582
MHIDNPSPWQAAALRAERAANVHHGGMTATGLTAVAVVVAWVAGAPGWITGGLGVLVLAAYITTRIAAHVVQERMARLHDMNSADADPGDASS